MTLLDVRVTSSVGARLRIAATPLLTALLLTAPPTAGAGPAADLEAKAAAVTADPGHGKILYIKHCVACHRGQAWGDGPREIPALAGQNRRYLLEQLARYATGERPGSLKHSAAMHDTLQAPDLNRPQADRRIQQRRLGERHRPAAHASHRIIIPCPPAGRHAVARSSKPPP